MKYSRFKLELRDDIPPESHRRTTVIPPTSWGKEKTIASLDGAPKPTNRTRSRELSGFRVKFTEGKVDYLADSLLKESRSRIEITGKK